MCVFILVSIKNKQIYQILGTYSSLKLAREVEKNFKDKDIYPTVIIRQNVLNQLN